jgi:tetratricopeptide (TPR) repeat protein
MRFGTSSVRLLLLLAFLGPVTATDVSAQTRVNGTVNDDAGKPVKAATVMAEHPDSGQSFTATTDAKGHFSVIGLRPGRWRFMAQAPGYLVAGTETSVRAGNNANPELVLAIRRSGVLVGALGSVTAKDLQSDLSAAEALFGQKKWDEAIKAYREILAKTPVLSFLNLQVAAAYRAKGDRDAAIAAYTELLKVDPQNERAQVALGQTQIEKGNAAAAETLWTEAATAGTAGREVLYSLGELAATQGHIDAAARWYGRAADVDPSWGKPLYKMGMSAASRGDKTAATNYLTRAMTVDPTSPEATLAKTAVEQLK